MVLLCAERLELVRSSEYRLKTRFDIETIQINKDDTGYKDFKLDYTDFNHPHYFNISNEEYSATLYTE